MIRWIAILMIAGAPLAANDTLATLGAGGLVPIQSSQIVMEREALEISVHQITVRYVFRNVSDKDVEATVAFPLPELEGGLVEHEPLKLPDKTKANFVDFEVMAEGKPVATKMEVRAFHEGHDITDRLRSAGLPVLVSDPGMETATGKLSKQQHLQFEKDEILVSDDPGAPNKRFWAYWSTRVQFYWTQHFPARGTIEVQHQYRPVVGGVFEVPAGSIASEIKPYCGRDVKVRHSVQEKRIKYILTTANNWRGPIRDFRLTVLAESPNDIVLTCMPGLKRVAPTRYELVRANFRPDRELDLLILQ
jgi:hypothetical protein